MPRLINMADRFEKVTKAQTKTTSGTTDTLKAVMDFLGKNADKMKVGQGMEINLLEGDKDGRKTLGTARARLVSVTREGEPWAGQDYGVKIDRTTNPDKPVLIVMRKADLDKPRPKKTGGRKAGTPNKPKVNGSSLQEAMGMNGAGGEKATHPEVKDVTVKDLT